MPQDPFAQYAQDDPFAAFAVPVASHDPAKADPRSWTDAAIDLLPTAGGVAGGVIGATAGPLTGVAGAGLGGVWGEAIRQKLQTARGKQEEPSLAEAVGDVATQGAVQAGSQVGGLAVGAGLRTLGKGLYWSHLKPSTALPASTRAQMVETGLAEKIPITERGAAKILGPTDPVTQRRMGGGLLTKSMDKADALVAEREALLRRTGVPAAYSVDPKQAVGGIASAVKDVKGLPVAGPQMRVIGDRGRAYLAEHRQPIPLTKAQANVRQTDKFYDKAYREAIDKGDPTKSGQAAADIGINDATRNILRDRVPGLKDQNAVTSRLASLGEAVEGRAAARRNLSAIGMQHGISAGIGTAAGAVNGTDSGVKMFILAEALTNPALASRLAYRLAQGGSAAKTPQAIRQALIALMASHAVGDE